MSDAGGETLPETKFRFDVVGGDEGDWRVVYLHASEKLSRCYEGTLLLAHPLPAPDASALMGKHVGVEVSRGAGGRNLRGLVRRVESMGSTGAMAADVPKQRARSRRYADSISASRSRRKSASRTTRPSARRTW